MITLHHLEKSRSMRIVWALEELGVAYEIKHYKRLPNYAAPPELKTIHPLGKSPILTDGEVTLAESAVILEYLQATYDTEQKFKPHTPAQQREYNYWMHYAEGSLMPLLVMSLVMSFVPQRVPFIIRPLANKIVDGVKSGFISPRLNDHVPFLENHLNAHEYFAGEFSFADIQMSFPMIAMQERMQGNYPHMKAFVERIKQRPAYQRAQAKGD